MRVSRCGDEHVTNPRSASLHFTTDAFAPAERVAAWREVYGQIVELEFEPIEKEAFRGETRMQEHLGLGVASIAMRDTHFSKPRHLGSSDDVLLLIVESGRWVGTHMGREVYLGPGDAVLGWTAETITGRVEGESSIVHVPTAAIAPMVGDVHAGIHRRIPAGSDTLRLLRPYMRTLTDQSTTPALQRLATTHVCDLIAMMCGASGEAAAVARNRGGQAARLRAIKDDVAQNLEHGDVSLGAVAARHRVSPRTLQNLFDSDGTTFSEYVLGQRLAHAHHALSDPRRAAEKIASIAFAAGFGDVSYFYRAFRRRYDVLPTDVRAAARRPN
jgi:AraC-like DNA-binding protein